jgi:hypothetical protein
MDLRPYVDNLRHELAVAADASGEDARALAERLTAPLESATQLILLNVLSAAADEITRDLAPGSVDLRLRRGEPEFVVTPADQSFEDEIAAVNGAAAAEMGTRPLMPSDAEDGAMARINLRLPEHLKARVEEAAGRESLSVNAWLVRAAAAAVDQADRDQRPSRRGAPRGQRYTGWVR